MSAAAVLDKPLYQIPAMAEIDAIPWNGLTIVSTFSGCGGSCLGFKMAGYRVAWASEFIPAAQETYRANHAGTILDTRDIRLVTAQEIIDATGIARGEIDVLEGSPPCASFSTAGKRESDWGKVKSYSDSKQRTDDLFFEYIRLVNDLQPKVFVAENVSGLVKGTAKGYFKQILAAMKACGYRVEAKLLDAQWLGVPQARQRIIFVGVRNDIDAMPAFPKPLSYRYSVRDALPWIEQVRKGERFGEYRYDDARVAVSDTIGSGPASGNNKDNTSGTVIVGIENANGYNGHADMSPDEPMQTVQAQRPVRVAVQRFDETDITRYAIGAEWDKLKPGEASEKFFSLKKSHPDRPCLTVSHRGGDGGVATVTHPTERRKFTIAELRRICGFPDDFILTGTYAQQWERLGRSVPPPMMAAVASTIAREVFNR